MDYEQARQYIADAGVSGTKLGLPRMRELLERLGNPEKKQKIIHIAGTNGKGSVAAFISSILAAGGYVAGRYVSPVVFRYEECIQREDRTGVHFISRQLLAEAVTEVAAAVKSMREDGRESPTVFEIETAMSFLAFSYWNCDAVVLETGLGGREDATNAVDRVAASVITPVAMDHRELLGDTISEIAGEKAGIIKENSMVITLQREQEALDVIAREAAGKNSVLHTVERGDIALISADLYGNRFTYRGTDYETGMPGLYQVENACLAIEACRCLSGIFPMREEKILSGLRRGRWPGRFQVVSDKPLTILDGAHNPAGAQALRESCEGLLGGRTLHGVMGVLRDKQYAEMVRILAPVFSDIVAITPGVPRGLDRHVLAAEWRKNGCPDVREADDVSEAVRMAEKRCRAGDAVLVFGSLSFFNRYPCLPGER